MNEDIKCSLEKKRRTWYNNPKFPLIPEFTSNKGNEYNTSRWSFQWLFIKLWIIDSFQFELAFNIDPTHWGIGITAMVPYLRIVLCIPVPYEVELWVMKHLWRHPKKY